MIGTWFNDKWQIRIWAACYLFMNGKQWLFIEKVLGLKMIGLCLFNLTERTAYYTEKIILKRKKNEMQRKGQSHVVDNCEKSKRKKSIIRWRNKNNNRENKMSSKVRKWERGWERGRREREFGNKWRKVQ